MTSSPAAAQHLRDLAWLRRVRDRIDREYAQPLDVEALARGAHMSAGHLSRQFRLAYGESPYAYLMTRRIERAMALLRRGDLSVTDISYYDYYQPEAFIPSSGLYIEKDLSINEEIEKLRLSATSSLLTGRRDVIVVASVSMYLWNR